MSITHNTYMKRALELARQGWGRTLPNPMVGAVIVANGAIVGEGFHKAVGRAHAERMALDVAGDKAKGATLYVTLEPCSHHGRTPPCVGAIIAAGIREVVYGMVDPHAPVNGQGLAALTSAGISVVGPVCEDECRHLNRAYIKWVTTQMPYVTLKVALTLDGKIADGQGGSKWISNEQARDYTHFLRAGVSAVAVGERTDKVDNPILNVRLEGYEDICPEKIVIPSKNADLKAFFSDLGARGIVSVLVEGGGRLHTALLNARLADEVVAFMAPKWLGSSATPWMGDLGNILIESPYSLDLYSLRIMGNNAVFEGKVVYPCLPELSKERA